MTNAVESFDGFYFQPSGENVEFNYFKFNEDKDRGDKVGNNSMGDMFHIILWTPDEIGLPTIEDNYEAILIDPVFYAEHLTKATEPVYGVIVRKTTESFKFVETYLKKFEDSVKKAVQTLEEIQKPKKK